jgi:hypothetical protein
MKKIRLLFILVLAIMMIGCHEHEDDSHHHHYSSEHYHKTGGADSWYHYSQPNVYHYETTTYYDWGYIIRRYYHDGSYDRIRYNHYSGKEITYYP